MNQKLEVTAIENGTVIDHLPANSLFKIIGILKLDEEDNGKLITFGTNFHSKRMGIKAIIKLSDRYCADEEINRIAIVAPHACVNTIKDFKVIEKRLVKVPSHIEGFVKCANPKCITNNERIMTKFRVETLKNGDVEFHCHYCEKTTHGDQAVLLK